MVQAKSYSHYSHSLLTIHQFSSASPIHKGPACLVDSNTGSPPVRHHSANHYIPDVRILHSNLYFKFP